jgi:hypothetical protein
MFDSTLRRSYILAARKLEDDRQGEIIVAYNLEGSLLEVCTCNILCPCWVGEDPDNATCDSVMGWQITSGQVDGLDVTGRTVAALVHIPGNVLKGNWKVALFVDDGATDAPSKLPWSTLLAVSSVDHLPM